MTAVETLQLGAERAPFVMLPRWLLHSEVSDGAKVLYCMLHDLVAGREGPTRPVSRAQLAAGGRVSVDTVDRRLAELIRIGAVEKQTQFETERGQLANVYWVRLSPPVALVRGTVAHSGPGRGGATSPVVPVRPAPPHGCGDPGRMGAAPKEEQDQEFPPQPPRTAGGPTGTFRTPRRRPGGTTLRAVGANPRAETDRVVAAEQAAAAARRAADLEAATAARRAAEATAQADTDRFVVEASAVSAVLDDDLLVDLVDLVGSGLAGPLARSPLALTRTVVGWCRSAIAVFPGPVPVALRAAVAAGWQPAGDPPTTSAAMLPAPPETTDLRTRIARLVHRDEVVPAS